MFERHLWKSDILIKDVGQKHLWKSGILSNDAKMQVKNTCGRVTV